MYRFVLLLLLCTFWFAGEAAAGEKGLPSSGGGGSMAAAQIEEALCSALQKGSMDGVWEQLKGDAENLRSETSMFQRKMLRSTSNGPNAMLLWPRDGMGLDLHDLLRFQMCFARLNYKAELPAEKIRTDAAKFAQACILLDLQLPHMYSLWERPVPRDYKCSRENIGRLKGRYQILRTMLSNADKWSLNAKTALFYVWCINMHPDVDAHKVLNLGGFDILKNRNWSSREAKLLFQVASRRTEEMAQFASGMFRVPPDSVQAKAYGEKLRGMDEAGRLLVTQIKRHRGNHREAEKYFGEAARLFEIWHKWSRASDYIFYWSDVSVDQLGEEAPEILKKQLPLSGKHVRQMKDLWPGNSQKTGVAGIEFPALAGVVAPEDPLEIAVCEYNITVFKARCLMRARSGKRAGWLTQLQVDTRTMETFRKDLEDFARIISSFHKGLSMLSRQGLDAFPGDRRGRREIR